LSSEVAHTGGPCIIILAAPSGSGKSSLARKLIEAIPSISFSVSATTRVPRESEVNGVHYHFIRSDAFENAIARDELLEYEEVYPGCYYGTLRSEVNRSSQDSPVLLDIDVVGALNVKEEFGAKCLALFVQAPSVKELEVRLEARGTESAESLRTRIEKARHELTYAKRFDAVIVNDHLDKASTELIGLVRVFMDSF
jgi:guanylate kinase